MALPQRIEFTRHIFATHTYRRDLSQEQVYKQITSNYNRYIQTLRRHHNVSINYLRVVEQHKDGYPHLHSILQFPDARIRILNTRYFDNEVYSKWKSFWRHGHSDYQKPRRSGIGTLSYVMKYLLKNQTAKTIWKKTLPAATVTEESTSTNTKISSTTKLPVRIHGVKLATWSREFDFSVFLARRPESIVKGLKY